MVFKRRRQTCPNKPVLSQDGFLVDFISFQAGSDLYYLTQANVRQFDSSRGEILAQNGYMRRTCFPPSLAAGI